VSVLFTCIYMTIFFFFILSLNLFIVKMTIMIWKAKCKDSERGIYKLCFCNLTINYSKIIIFSMEQSSWILFLVTYKKVIVCILSWVLLVVYIYHQISRDIEHYGKYTHMKLEGKYKQKKKSNLNFKVKSGEKRHVVVWQISSHSSFGQYNI
jgi:hypothetical protein